MSFLTEALYASIANGRSVPFPLQLVSKVRRQKAKQKATEAARSSGCPCTMRGYIGEESGDEITLASKMIFECQHVRRLNGEPYLVHIRYDSLISYGRSVPNCPIRLAGRPGFVYSVEFFEQFAAKHLPRSGVVRACLRSFQFRIFTKSIF